LRTAASANGRRALVPAANRAPNSGKAHAEVIPAEGDIQIIGFRLEDRIVLQQGLPIEAQRSELGPMWQRYHQKFAGEQERRQRDAALVANLPARQPSTVKWFRHCSTRSAASVRLINPRNTPRCRGTGAGCER
jgi:hypothetical protein